MSDQPTIPEGTPPAPVPAPPAPTPASIPAAAPPPPAPTPAATPPQPVATPQAAPAPAVPPVVAAPAPTAEPTAAPSTQPAPASGSAGSGFVWGTGRRKSSVARVRIRPGDGKFLVNKREVNDYFSEDKDRNLIVAPLKAAGLLGKMDVLVRVHGGGHTGQAGAIALGVGRAMKTTDQSYEHALREGGFLTRDPRMKERKKYGQRGARRRFQFSKR